MLHVGAGIRDITPEASTWLGGYMPSRTWTRVHDRLSARALALREGDTTVVLIAADSIGFLRPLADAVRAAAAEATGVPAECVHLAATHSHSTPDVMGIYGGVPDAYRTTFVAQCAAAAQAAFDALRPARMRVAQAEIPAVSMNRRIPPGALDRQVTALQFGAEGGDVIATFVNLSLHPVCLGPDNRVVTADYVHWLRKELEAAFGGTALFTNGTEGNVNPAPQLHAEDRLDRTGGTFAQAEATGRALAETVTAALADAAWRDDATLGTLAHECELPVENEAFLQGIAAGAFPGDAERGVASAPLGLIAIGGVRLLTLPVEAFAEIGLAIKSWWPDEPVAIIGLCDGHYGYIVPPEQFTADEYEESVSPARAAWPALERGLRALAAAAPTAAGR